MDFDFCEEEGDFREEDDVFFEDEDEVLARVSIFELFDLEGVYSLLASSVEEEPLYDSLDPLSLSNGSLPFDMKSIKRLTGDLESELFSFSLSFFRVVLGEEG